MISRISPRRFHRRPFPLPVLAVVVALGACDDIERVPFPTLGVGSSQGAKNKMSSDDKGKIETKQTSPLNCSDEDFVESDRNRDPFRGYTTLFKIEAPQAPQRKVVMSNTSIEEMKLIAIISGTPTPKAMLVDPLGVGYVVERGMYIGKPQIVRASENVLLTLNWRVDRIRPNEVVLTREDPADPNRPPLTRVIALREEETAGKK